MDMIRRIDQELRGELGKPHHWGVEIKWWGKRNKKEISKKNHKICLFGKIIAAREWHWKGPREKKRRRRRKC